MVSHANKAPFLQAECLPTFFPSQDGSVSPRFTQVLWEREQGSWTEYGMDHGLDHELDHGLDHGLDHVSFQAALSLKSERVNS